MSARPVAISLPRSSTMLDSWQKASPGCSSSTRASLSPFLSSPRAAKSKSRYLWGVCRYLFCVSTLNLIGALVPSGPSSAHPELQKQKQISVGCLQVSVLCFNTQPNWCISTIRPFLSSPRAAKAKADICGMFVGICSVAQHSV